jgi:hypothetical protein
MDGATTGDRAANHVRDAADASISAVSWAAVIAGAVAAAATSLILLGLGSGFGLASVSPWSNAGVSITAFSVMTAIWLIVIQWVSSCVGGYLTGRLRTKWVGTHTHEVFFRDTAHGFLAWAVATLLVVGLAAAATSAAISGGARATTAVAAGAAQGAAGSASSSLSEARAYDVDTLFRAPQPDANAAAGDAAAQATRILAAGITYGDVSAGDRTYLAQLVAARTGIPQAEAQTRVDNVIAQEKAAETKARQAADTARKAASAFSIFTALSMLIGAFIAAVAAALGGRLRDEHP